MRITVYDVLSYLAAGMTEERLSHEHTMRVASTAMETTGRLVRAFLEEYP